MARNKYALVSILEEFILNRVLEKQVADLKEKLYEVVEKSEVDDRLIAELKKELKKAVRNNKKAVECDKCHEKDRRLKDQQVIVEKLQRGLSPDSKAGKHTILSCYMVSRCEFDAST